MTTQSAHQLVLASAGTGKTYRLALRYLALGFRGVPPERILATTFTRKAAGEILERVLKRLWEAVEEPEKLAALARDLDGLGVTRERALTLLASFVRGAERLRVSTLDAFFAGVARAYALDLGLPPAWRIVDDETDEELQGEALSSALAEAERGEILALLADLQRRAAECAVHARLVRTLRAGREHYLESTAEAWEQVDVPAAPSEGELDAAIEFVERFPVPLTKTKDKATGTFKESSTWRKDLDRVRPLLRAGNWKEAFRQGFLGNVAKGSTTFGTGEIDAALLERARILLRQLLHETIAALVNENRAARELFARFETSLARLRRERGALRFDDLPLAIAPPGSHPLEARRLELAWRLDGRIDHLLLDEFQDTSPLQWRCLAPLAEEILADGSGERTFFCVGDVKQSIYGWRGGEPRLLASMPERFPALGEPITLAKSFRSSQVVLDVANEVFSALADNDVFAEAEGGRLEAAREFEARYPRHTAGKDLPGHAVLMQTRPKDDEKGERYDAPLVELAIERVAAVHAEMPKATIAVLLRTKKWVPRLILGLARKGIRASGEGGNPLTDSGAVLEILSLLHLADHPDDGAAQFHVARSPLRALLAKLHPRAEDDATFAGTDEGEPRGGAEAERAHVDRLRAEDDDVLRIARAARREIAANGYGAWLARLFPLLAASKDYGGWDVSRVAQLVEIGIAFDATPTARTGEFVRHVRRERVEDPSAAQIKIMTVHASKGLEFDAVILPELAAASGRDGDAFLTERATPDGPIERITRKPSLEIAEQHPLLKHLYHLAVQRSTEGDLCVLYVALTRAKHRLEMLVPWRKPDAKPTKSAACILRRALGNEPLPGEPQDRTAVLWRHAANTDAWWIDADAETAAEERPTSESKRSAKSARRDATPSLFDAPSEPAAAAPNAPASSPTPTKLVFAPSKRASSTETRSASAEEHGPALTPAELLRAVDVDASVRGTLVHGLLAEVEWLDAPHARASSASTAPPNDASAARPSPASSALPSDARLRELARALEHDERRIDEALAEFHAALARPAVRALLTRPATEDELVVWRERRFALHLPSEDGVEELWQGAFDRVVLVKRVGRIVRAELIDWKSDHVAANDVAARAATYRPQLEAYRRIVARLTQLDERAITARIAFVHVGTVVELR